MRLSPVSEAKKLSERFNKRLRESKSKRCGASVLFFCQLRLMRLRNASVNNNKGLKFGQPQVGDNIDNSLRKACSSLPKNHTE